MKTYLGRLALHGMLHRLHLLLGALIGLLNLRLLHLGHLGGHSLHGDLLGGLLVHLIVCLGLGLGRLGLSLRHIVLLKIVSRGLVLLAVVGLAFLHGRGRRLGALWIAYGLLYGLLLHKVFLLGDIVSLSWPRFLVLLDHSLLNFKL